jgi:hypothetical protein
VQLGSNLAGISKLLDVVTKFISTFTMEQGNSVGALPMSISQSLLFREYCKRCTSALQECYHYDETSKQRHYACRKKNVKKSSANRDALLERGGGTPILRMARRLASGKEQWRTDDMHHNSKHPQTSLRRKRTEDMEDIIHLEAVSSLS